MSIGRRATCGGEQFRLWASDGVDHAGVADHLEQFNIARTVAIRIGRGECKALSMGQRRN